jgi:AraC-like DNA-binding protein
LFRKGEPFSSALFADGHTSIVFSFGPAYHVDPLWRPGACGPYAHVIGAMTAAHPASHGRSIVQAGAFFRGSQARCFLGVRASELTDRIIALDSLWGASTRSLELQLAEARSDSERISRLESALLGRIALVTSRTTSVNMAALTAHVCRHQGNVTVEQLAQGAGISRQHLTRVFSDEVGVAPKLYCRLARFRAALTHGTQRARHNGAELAATYGYTDQSHMIAEFREFSSFTPVTISARHRFHPFIGGEHGGA